ncbi:hypothetical protein [Shewanella surugensis]|uniref:Uncharacterized protein n=1 Tax=Shewanella surugensis TaxID=212020 RepID=A0ABT0L6T0_9GAMM|nr:hypothetical protein [Shewanella surugensis]MCL1123195.1 hypothetical protein [Shewanella surugensis]
MGQKYSHLSLFERQLALAENTYINHSDKLLRLYEQNACETLIAEYVKHWLVWVRSGVEIDLKQVIELGLNSDLGQALTRKYRVDALYFR